MKALVWTKDGIRLTLRRIFKNDPSLSNVRKKYPRLYSGAPRRYGSWLKAIKAAGIDFKLVSQKRLRKFMNNQRKHRKTKIWEGENNIRIIKEFIEHQKIYRQNTAKSISHYISALRHLRDYLKSTKSSCEINEIRKEDLTSFFIHLNNNKAKGRRYLFYNLNRFFKFCCFNGYVKSNPLDPYLRPRFVNNAAPKILGKGEISAVIAQIDSICYQSKFVKYRNALMFYMFLFCGLRTNEIANLKLEDIDLSRHSINIINSKYGKSRVLPVNKLVLPRLLDYLNIRKGVSIPNLFLSNFQDRPLSRLAIYDSMARIGEKIIHKKTNPRALRHYFASSLLSGGVGLIAIRDLMGHADLRTTSKYIYISPDYLRKEIRKHPLYKTVY